MHPLDISRRQLLVMAVLTEGGLAVIACAVGWVFGARPWELLRWEPLTLVRTILITSPMLVVFVGCVLFPVGPLAPIKQFVDQVVKPLFRKCSLLDFALVAALAGFGEELLFRGVIQPFLMDWFESAPWIGLLLASLLFGLVHAITPGYVVMAAVIGLYLGWCAYSFDNLTEVALAHALYDFVALVYLVRCEKDRHPVDKS